jgi:amidase
VNVQEELQQFSALLDLLFGAFESEGDHPLPRLSAYLEALALRDQAILAWEQFFEEWDVLLCPPSLATAFAHCEPGSPLRVDEQEVSYWLVSAHSALFNYTGHPAVVLPYAQDRDGLPLGIQVVSKRWSESRLLAIAQALVPVTGSFRRPRVGEAQKRERR